MQVGAGSVASIVLPPMVMPISKTVMVPPAKRANSESCRPHSAPAMPSPKSATMNPILPRYDQADRGMSRLRQRPMIPHTWKKTTSTSRTAHKSILVVNMTRQAPSLGPVWEERGGKGKSGRDIALPIEHQGSKHSPYQTLATAPELEQTRLFKSKT